jgi:hypothetical protein
MVCNFVLQHLKLYTLMRKIYHQENCFETYPTWIYFYRSRHNECNGANKIKNRCLARKLSHFKVYMSFANAKETDLTHSTWSAPLPASTIHARSPLPMRRYTVDPPCATRPYAAIWPSARAPTSDWELFDSDKKG